MRSLLAMYAAACFPPVARAATVSAAFDAFGDADVAVASTVVALAVVLLGLALVFAGRRHLRACVFFGALLGGGFAMASGVIDAALAQQRDSSFFSSSSSSESSVSPALAALASWVGFFTCGCAIGAVAAGVHQRLALALIGGFSGVSIAFIVHLAWDHFVLLAVVLGVLLGVLAAGWKEPHPTLVIVPTSIAGSALVLLAVAFFTGGFPTTYELVKFWARAKLRGSWIDAVPGSWWVYFAAFVALAVIGAITQFVLERTWYKADRRPEEAPEAAGEDSPHAPTVGERVIENCKASGEAH
jgi:hypothetical protein